MAAHNPTSSKHLEDQAAAAALYVTEPQKKVRDARKDTTSPLDANGKLTSASAATSLKRADARDLPSFPSSGGLASAAGGAAGLAVQNTKSPEWWKPGDASAGASAAALAAKDYKMKPLWEPEASSAGSKAALLAHQKGHGLNLWEPTASDKALMAAAGAAAGQKGGPVGRKAKDETGLADRYPDERNAAKNALKAATSVHATQSRNDDLPGYTDEEAAKIRQQATVKGLNSSLFGSNPLIGPELAEQQHQAALHATAVSMAQGMYGKREAAYREKMGAAQAGSRAAAGRALDHDSDDEDTPMSFMGLQEAAQKLANERLAKLNDPDAAFREHYGTNSPPPKSRLSMFGGGSVRRKDSDEDMSDERKSRKIRGEMNLFQDKLKEIDARKRKDDRSALLAAAQRNVKALSAEMDEDVFQRTGKMSPAMKADWETQARARAQAASEARTANFGKVNIGGGKYMDQTEIDGIAQSRLQPTLDAITAKAAHDREVDEQNRINEEERRRLEREAKEQEKYDNMKVKEEWKRFKAEEKAEQDARKQEEKAVHDQEKAAQRDAKMQEKFEQDQDKEREHELKALGKEHDKQQKEEWKAFKEQEKDDEKTKKEEKRGSRLGSLFRRKSKKDKEPSVKSEKREPTVIPAGAATTTTTISAGQPATIATSAPAAAVVVPAAERSVTPVHHEEPHHNPLTALEETPEARAANQQKPGGDLLSVFKRKKADHDEKKRHSIAESATAGAATGAAAGTATAAVVGKDEPGKAQPSTGTPAAEAVAPEHAEIDKSAISAPVAAAPLVTDKVEVPATEPVTFSAPATTTPAVAPVPETSSSTVPDTHIPIAFPVRPSTDSNPRESMASNRLDSVVSYDDSRYVDASEDLVPASTTGATVTSSNVHRAEKPAVHDAGHETTPAPAVAAVAAPVEQAAPVHKESTSSTAAPSETTYAAAPGSKTMDTSKSEPVAAAETISSTVDSEQPLAMGSDKPVSKEVNHSKILDAIEPRVNVGKPEFTGNEKLAAASADMRGTDHAGAAGSSKDTSAATSAPVTSLGPAAAGPVAEGTSSSSTGKDVSASHNAPTSAKATHEGDKVSAPVADRIAVSSEAAAAAEEAGDNGGKHGTPRKEGASEKKNRLSGFFKNKLGMKIKEHKGSDGVVVTPTTQYTTMGKYVDPKDKHSDIHAAAVPANAAILDAGAAGSKTAHESTTATSATTATGTSSTPQPPILAMDPAAGIQIGATKTEHLADQPIDNDASAIAVDPAFQHDETVRGRTTRGKGVSEESDEARDTVAEQLSPPKIPGLPRASESPARETRFKEELFG